MRTPPRAVHAVHAAVVVAPAVETAVVAATPVATAVVTMSNRQIGLVLAIILGAIAALVLFSYVLGIFRADIFTDIFSRGDDTSAKIEQAVGYTSLGEFPTAVTFAREALASGENFAAQEALDVSLFSQGGKENRIEAIRSVKSNYMKSTRPDYRALQINLLLGYIMAGREKYVYKEVFSGEPFESLKVPGEWYDSVRNLAELSLSNYPTSAAKFRVGLWYVDKIKNAKTAAEKKQYADDLVKVIKEAEEILPVETALREGAGFDYMTEARFHFWVSFLYGEAAAGDLKYLAESDAALQRLVAYYESTLDKNGQRIPLIAARLPDAYITHAKSLYRLKGGSAEAQIRADLNALIAIIREKPSVHEGLFISLLRTVATKEGPGKDEYIALAKMHPPFAEFLREYGWTNL